MAYAEYTECSEMLSSVSTVSTSVSSSVTFILTNHRFLGVTFKFNDVYLPIVKLASMRFLPCILPGMTYRRSVSLPGEHEGVRFLVVRS